MRDDKTLAEARHWYAHDIAAVAPVVNTPAIVDAFAAVPREHYLGPGPWGMHARLMIGEINTSPSNDPRHLYHDVLVSIDQARGINNGLPSLWARVYDQMSLLPGATVLQVGAGVGYYTAILAELVGHHGTVIAYETEPDLATRAAENLKLYDQVDVVCADATLAQDLPRLDAVTACAGVTHVPDHWLDRLATNAKLVLPYTGTDGWGILLHLTKAQGNAHPVRSIGRVGVYPCTGARTDAEARAISAALATAQETPDIAAYHVGGVAPSDRRIWVAGGSHWITAGARGGSPA